MRYIPIATHLFPSKIASVFGQVTNPVLDITQDIWVCLLLFWQTFIRPMVLEFLLLFPWLTRWGIVAARDVLRLRTHHQVNWWLPGQDWLLVLKFQERSPCCMKFIGHSNASQSWGQKSWRTAVFQCPSFGNSDIPILADLFLFKGNINNCFRSSGVHRKLETFCCGIVWTGHSSL